MTTNWADASAVSRGVAWVAAIILGLLLGLIGLVLIIIGALRRSSSRKEQRAVPA